MAELPYMQFFPADYLRDTEILSLPAQGAWMRIICSAWHPARRGVVAMRLPTLARLLHGSEASVRALLEEIAENGVGEVVWSEDGRDVTVTCRRIARDWTERERGRAILVEAGRRGAGKRWAGQKKPDSPPSGPPISDPSGDPNGEAIERLMADQSTESRDQSTDGPSSVRTSPDAPEKPTDDNNGDDIWLAYDWQGYDQETAFGMLSQLFPDIDVWGEYQRFKRIRLDMGQKPTWKPFIAWLKKASPVMDLGRKRPGGGKAQANTADPEGFAEWFAEYYPTTPPTPYANCPEIVQYEFRTWKGDG